MERISHTLEDLLDVKLKFEMCDVGQADGTLDGMNCLHVLSYQD